uniref:Uncharacterized protein n=1 Tax=Strombidium inclinatum TaxID=197538 RepID=A0A7S3IN91_9SPIT|mmetsp:Transcript_30044/g.45929  ORF Transcript_30044/g.45929 Transcript_30044/m.45929 type:complete len:135 (+) Transcript_30044:1134-1538(+)
MACILIEMYTGELFFETRDDAEHLAMIEKECGPLPSYMIDGSSHETKRYFGPQHKFSGFEMKVNLQKHCRSSSVNQWKKMRLARELIQHEFNSFHSGFLSLIEFMMKADPSKRPSARSCLDHNFLKLEIPGTDQ